jgi:hypothetical protein
VTSQLDFSTVLLDEADAVLLDESNRPFRLLRASDASTKDWSQAIHLARVLTADDVDVDVLPTPSTHLTAAGEARVTTLAGAEEMHPVDRLLLLHDVEMAHTAIRVVKADHHYYVRSGQVVPLDPSSGWRTPNVTPTWVAPLERHLGLRGRSRTTVIHQTDGITILRRFERISGCSGTVVGEALDYLLLFGLLPAVIPPRQPRHQGRLPDLLAKSRESAHRWIAEQVDEHGPLRPILIATDSTDEALEIAERLEGKRIEGVSVRAVSDETIASERLFETAGRPGTTIVSTRVAGRGVDMPLSAEARANGGAMLIAVGHAEEARLDRQLLGRVGRQGDPYTARFVNHPEDTLTSQRANKQALERSLSLTSEEVLASRQFNRQMASAQRALRRLRIQQFAYRMATDEADRETYDMLRDWWRAMGAEGDDLPDGFLTFLAERHMARRFPGLSPRSSVPFAEPERVAGQLAELVGRPQDARRLVVQAAGESAETAHRVFTDYLVDTLTAASAENDRAGQELRQRADSAARSVLDLRLLAFARALLGADGRRGDEQTATATMRAALDAGAADGLWVPRDVTVRRFDEIQEWLDADEIALDDDGVGKLAVAAVRVTDDSDETTVALRAELDELAATRMVTADLDERWSSWAERSASEVARETVAQAADRLSAGTRRTAFQVRQTVGPTRRASAYQSRMEDLRLEMEANLASELCANLAACADPSRLDELFAEHDRRVTFVSPRLQMDLPLLPQPDAPLPALDAPAQTSEADLLVAEYVDAVCADAGGGDVRGRHELYRELKLLVGDEVGSLSDPDRVKAAYGRWKGEMRDRIPPWRWRNMDRHVRDFLRLLTDRGVAAPLPVGLVERSRSWARRVRREASAPGMLITLLALVGGALLALALAAIPPPSSGLVLGDGAQLVDRLLTGGTLSAGSALGALLFGLVGGAWVRWLVGPSVEQQAGATPAEHLASFALILAGALLVVQPWNADAIWLFAAGVLGWIALAAVAALARNVVYLLEQVAHLRLTALLGAAFAGGAALPLLVRLGGNAPVALAAAGMAALLVFGMPLRKVRIEAVALQAGSDDTGGLHTLRVPLRVQGRLSVAPHAFGLLFAWAASCLLLAKAGAVVQALAASAAYLTVLAFWARTLARSGTDVDAWQRQMRGAGQAYEPTQSAPTLADALDKARTRILTRELATAVLLVAAGTLLALSAPASSLDTVPVGVATVFVVAATVDLARGFARSLRAPLAGVVEPSSVRYDEVVGADAYAAGALNHLRRRMGIAAAAVVLAGIADILSILQLLLDAAQWFADLVT